MPCGQRPCSMPLWCRNSSWLLCRKAPRACGLGRRPLGALLRRRRRGRFSPGHRDRVGHVEHVVLVLLRYAVGRAWAAVAAGRRVAKTGGAFVVWVGRQEGDEGGRFSPHARSGTLGGTCRDR